MQFPALVSWGRRLGRWFLYELLRLALGPRLLGSLRSALGGGGLTNGGPRRAGPAVRPRGPGVRRGRAPFPQPAA